MAAATVSITDFALRIKQIDDHELYNLANEQPAKINDDFSVVHPKKCNVMHTRIQLKRDDDDD